MLETKPAPEPVSAQEPVLEDSVLTAGPVESVPEPVPASEPVSDQTPESGSVYYADAMYFDGAWYLAAYPDVGACGIDAVEHFMTHGYLEGRDPNAFFSVALYMEANPDIPLTINPFLHFIMHGAAEGRRLRP